MDTSIRTLLADAKAHTGPPPNSALQQVYRLLRNVAETKPAVDVPESFSPDLYVQCAETAFQFGENEIARECLKMYFMKPPPQNQFLCRAYLCQAQLLAPRDANNPEQLEKAVVYLLKAISFAKNITRYHFLVYNASVLFWQFCRPFLKPNYRQFLARSLHQVVKALDDIDDKDYEWRAQLMLALIECHLDAGRRSDASHIAAAASGFIKQHVPHLYKQLFGLIVRHQLMETTKLHKDLKTVPELAVYYKILKLKVALSNGENREFYQDIQNILAQVGPPASAGDKTKVTGRLSRTESRASGRPSSPPQTSSSRTTEEPDSAREGRDAARELSRESQRKASPSKAGRRTPTPTSSKKLQQDSEDRPSLLMELARLCIELDFPDLAKECVDAMKRLNIKDQGYFLEMEFLQCGLTMKNLRHKQDSYQSNIVDLRLHAIKRCEETIMNAIRHGDPNIIQVGCVTLWNLCLPLLQPNLRRRVRKPLTIIAEALEDIQSLLIQIRCQVHMELAKCEEDEEQIQVAMEHLRKAIGLDDGQVYQERLQVALHRLQLRSELYKTPERVEDQAGMIIEQARKADSGTMRMKRSLLVKAGEALAPDAFLLVLDSESDTKDAAGGKGPLTVIRQLAGKARQFMKCVKKAEGHLKRLGDENDCERARLWADLAKTARKQEVWDVCRVACRFCLLYDDGRWKYSPPSTKEKRKRSASPGHSEDEDVSPKLEKGRTEEGTGEVSSAQTTLTSSQMATPAQGDMDFKRSASKFTASRPLSPESANMNTKDLIRMLAEVNFINGEALVHLLRSEGVQLQDTPVPPEDKSKRPKGYVAKKADTDPDWIEYCDWIKYLSESATAAFLRGLALGVEINEPWLVCCAAAYIWNYHNHVLAQNRHREILDTLVAVLDGLKKVGHAGETIMLVHICNALAIAYIAPWIPGPNKEADRAQAGSPESTGKKGKGKDAGKKEVKGPIISPEAGGDLKKAIEVCEFAMQVTNGNNFLDVVPIAERLPILQVWVRARQMAQIQIGKSFGAEDESSSDGQAPMTRAIVANEMLILNKNGIFEFREAPTVKEVANMIEGCVWSDSFIELQMWTRLTYMAFDTKQHPLVVRCSAQALKFATSGSQSVTKMKNDRHQYMVEQEMLSYASILLGQSLMENMRGKNEIRRDAMAAFLDSARYARNANNHTMVMAAARHYWNACLPMIGQPIERELIKEPIRIILQCIKSTYDRPKAPKEFDDTEGIDIAAALEKGDGARGSKDVTRKGLMGSPSEDLSVWAALYGLLFQAYADKQQWQEALNEMDEAIDSMPRTKHRLIIFKHRVMVKAKLGLSVQMDIQKFRDESEDFVAHMWRRVALSARQPVEQLSSYQYAIEALGSVSNELQKVKCLQEFGQWLYCNHFPLEDCLDQVEWSIDILLNQPADPANLIALQQQQVPVRETKKGGAAEKKRKPLSSRKKGEDKSPKEEVKSKSPSTVKEEEINIADYIPIAKAADIGVLPSNPSLTLGDLCNVRQLDGLVQSHVLMAELTGRGSSYHLDHLLQAYSYLMRIWQVSIAASGPVMKELAKNPPPDAANGKGSPKGKKKEKDAPPAKEKPKRKGPLDVVPATVEDWSVYDIPDEIIEAFKQDTMKLTGINAHTFKKPLLTMHYLDELVKGLRHAGMNHLTLPVLAMQDLLSRTLLSSNSLFMLVHLRAMEVCYELDLKNASVFHEKLIEVIKMDEEEVASSRAKIAMWKEEQKQVADEERKVRENLMKMATEASSEARHKGVGQGTPTKAEPEEKLTESHLGRVLSSIQTRYVWTDTAEILIRLGHLQKAREFLNEALVSAEAFEDHQLRSRILYLLGTLSLEERQFGQAVNFAREAQVSYKGDEMFWYETTMLIANAAVNNPENDQSKKSAKEVLAHALNEFSILYDQRPNRMNFIGYVMAIMQAKLASIQADLILKEKNINNPKVMEKLLSACERFEQAANSLIQLGHLREAVPVLKEQARVLQTMAHEAIEPEIRHTYFLQALDILREAVALARDVNQNVLTILPLQDTKMLSLPTQRELADAELECGWLLVEVMRERHAEMRVQQREDQRKGSVLKMVEDLIRPTPDHTQMEREWLEIESYAGEEALTHLYNAHSLAGNISRLRARALINIGCCLKTVAMRQNPDAPAQWIAHELELMKMNTEAQGSDENETTTTEMSKSLETIHTEARQYLKYSEQIKNMKKQLGVAKTFQMQAAECLMQGLNLSLQKKFVDLCSKASFELMDMCGQYDPAVASLLLALAQSCQASLSLEQLLLKAQPDPCTSQMAALLHQRRNFLAEDIASNLSISTVFTAVNDSLREDWQAWKRLEISAQHLDLLKEFPPNFNFIILQHSPDKRFLYGALLDRPKAPSTGGKQSKQAAQPVVNRSKVYGVEVDPRVLGDLVKRFKEHKQRVQQRLLKIEYQRTQAAQRKKMLESLDMDIKQRSKTVMGDMESEEVELEEEFKQLVATMDAYLKPIMTPIEAALRSSTSPTLPSAAGAKEMHSAAAVGAPAPHEAVILLADPHLLHMPLEASDCLQSHDITSLSRDFSLQFFHHRYSQPDAPPPEGSPKKGDKKKEEAAAKGKKGGGKDEKPSRIPGLRDVKAKTAKAITLDRPLQPWQMPVDTGNFRYIVDPHLDCSETEEHKPLEFFAKAMSEYESQFTMRWLGILGSDHEPSIGEWEIYMSESSSVIFYGTERLLSQIPPSRVSELNIPDCMILYLLDLVQTSKSFLRQSKADVIKSKTLLMLEKPVETAMLVSLTGIKCLMANQWHCSLENNATKFQLTIKDLLEKGKTTGHTTRLLYSPQKRTEEETVNEEAELDAASPSEKDKGKKGRPTSGKASVAASKRSESPKESHKGSRKGSVKAPDSDRSGKAPSEAASEAITEEDEEKAPEETKQPEERKREWFNMVCYGLPNLVVTQVSS